MKIRKNARWLTSGEKDNFLKAVVTLKTIKHREGHNTMRLYDFYPLEHRLVRVRYRHRDDEPMGDGGHFGPGFPSWHREWLRRFEEDLRSVDSTVTLPYWDLTDQQNSTDVLFQADFMGGNGSGPDLKIQSGVFQERVPSSQRPSWWPDDDGGPLAGFVVSQGLTTLYGLSQNMQPSGFNVTGLTRDFNDFSLLPSRDDVRDLLALQPFATFHRSLEGGAYHGPGHNRVRGLMGAGPTSPNDPLFFLHHTGVDLIWTLWQQHPDHDQTRPENLPPSRSVQPRSQPLYGHFLEDMMWPWDGRIATNSQKARPHLLGPYPPNDPDARPPVFPLGTFMRTVDPADIVRVADVIDHHSLDYQYDVEIPLDLERDGVKLARLEPYFGDLALRGGVTLSASGDPGPRDYVWKNHAGTTLGWIDDRTGNLNVANQLIEGETDFSDTALRGAEVVRHYNQPLAYFHSSGNLHLKGNVQRNQPPIA